MTRTGSFQLVLMKGGGKCENRNGDAQNRRSKSWGDLADHSRIELTTLFL